MVRRKSLTKVKKISTKKVSLGRTYHVCAYESELFFKAENTKTFEKDTVYRVKEVWFDFGSVTNYRFTFETHELYPYIKNPRLAT